MAKKFPDILNNLTSFIVSRAPPETQLPSLAERQWLNDRRTRLVLDALEVHGAQARVVGGAVRNALLAEPVHDIDIATTAHPDAIISAAKNAGLKSVPTGIEHGTVTVIANSQPFEVTTLRRDVETDGRHAVVAFTDDWTEDAKRRDFTINAIYCDKDGVLFDPVGGFDDIKRQRVRFIGDADQRIKEDYLRILRFFRFTATYGQGRCDAVGLASCERRRAGLEILAGERVWAELKKLLVAPHASPVLDAMERADILASIFQSTCSVSRFSKAILIDTALKRSGDPVQRLAALCVDQVNDPVLLRQRLRLSTHAFDRLVQMAQNNQRPLPDTPERDAKIHLYHHGPEAFHDALLFAWSGRDATPDNKTWRHRFALTDRWQAPQFPVSGRDVLALGIEPGPSVGQILSELETWWTGEGFPDDPERLKKRLVEIAKVTKS